MLSMETNVVVPIRSIVPSWSFADRLRKARLTAGMTQREFAGALRVKASAYAQWEADNNGPRNVVKLAKDVQSLTGISAAWLVGIDIDPNTPRRNNPYYSERSGKIVPWRGRGHAQVAAA